MSSLVWHLRLVPGGCKVFYWSLGVRGLLPPLPTPLPCFLLLPVSLFKSSWKRRFLFRSYMIFSFLWSPNSCLAATVRSTFSLNKDDFSDLHSPALVLLMSKVERKRSRKPSQGSGLAHTSYFVAAILLQSPIQCQVWNILFSFSLMCLCSRPVVPIARRILLIRQAIMNSEEQQKKITLINPLQFLIIWLHAVLSAPDMSTDLWSLLFLYSEVSYTTIYYEGPCVLKSSGAKLISRQLKYSLLPRIRTFLKNTERNRKWSSSFT